MAGKTKTTRSAEELKDKAAYRIATALVNIQVKVSRTLGRKVNARSVGTRKALLLGFLAIGSAACIGLPLLTLRLASPLPQRHPWGFTDTAALKKTTDNKNKKCGSEKRTDDGKDTTTTQAAKKAAGTATAGYPLYRPGVLGAGRRQR